MPDRLSALLIVETDRHLAQADALKYGDPDALLRAAKAAASTAQQLGDLHRYARALVHQAWAYSFLNQYELSHTHALEVLSVARDYHMADIEAGAVGIIAANFLKCGILQEAVHLFEHQFLLGEQIQDVAVQAMALNDLAVVKMEMGDYQEALTLLRRAVPLIPAYTHDGMDRSIAHLNLAFAAVKTEQLDEAVEHAQEVLAQVKDFPKYISDAHLWIASAHLKRGEIDAARSRINLARACVEEATPPLYNDNVEQLTAELLTAQGSHEAAAHIWEYMYQMAIERHELDYAISALNNLKAAYERLNNTQGIIHTYKRLSEDIPAQQRQTSDLRFTVLRMVFAMDKATLQAELHLSEQKNAILTRLSHEFRTPLTIIRSSADLLQHYPEKLTLEQRQSRIQQINTQVKSMTVMLDDILEILRLDEGNSSLPAHTSIRLSNLADEALLQLDRYNLSSSRVQVQADQDVIHSDFTALQSILVHLLTNAIKFSKGEVKLHLGVSEETLVIKVIDQGIGIPAQEQQEVLKPLIRGSNLDEVPGSGIGLSIVSKWVNHLHGEIEIVSPATGGTTVTVMIPLT